MIFKKDSLAFGLILGLIGPVLGLLLFKFYKFGIYTFSQTFQFFLHEDDGHRILSSALTLSLLMNALLFTIYVNTRKDKTAKGIFISTVLYGVAILLIKTFG